jgi:hypothetical protein
MRFRAGPGRDQAEVVISEFLLEDAGDGWWHCRTPLRCHVVDGPAVWFPARRDARWPETYWLVRTDPPIEWHGDSGHAARWGPDHPLCWPIEPTSFALVMASSPWSGPLDLPTGAGVPVYPVTNAPTCVAEADAVPGLGIKAGLRAVTGAQ